MNKLRIGIVGAGTAGLATAIALSRDGHDVQVFEKHSSLAPIGAGVLIQPQGVVALDELGVGSDFTSVSVPIERLIGTCHRGWRLVDIRYCDVQARAVSRFALGETLLKAAQRAGAAVHFGADIQSIETASGSARIALRKERVNFDLVVIANGAASSLPMQTGMAVASEKYPWGALWGMFDVEGWKESGLLEQRFATTRKMYGIMPTAWMGDKLRVSFFWSLQCEKYAAWCASSLDQWKEELLQLWPESAPVVDLIDSHDRLAFATYYHAKPKSLAAPPVCIVGDAAHAMSPQLGLGSTLAVQDALSLAMNIARHGAVQGPLAYSKERLCAVRTSQALSRFLTPCFQADGNGLWRDMLFAAGLHVPGVPYLMYRSIAAPRKAKASRHPKIAHSS